MGKYLFCFEAMLLIVSNINAQTTISLSANDKGWVFERIGAVKFELFSKAPIWGAPKKISTDNLFAIVLNAFSHNQEE